MNALITQFHLCYVLCAEHLMLATAATIYSPFSFVNIATGNRGHKQAPMPFNNAETTLLLMLAQL